MTGIVILALALVAAAGFGLYRRVADGRFSTEVHAATTPDVASGNEPTATVETAEPTTWEQVVAAVPAAADLALGERATFVQFSSSFCAPCRTTRALLGDIADKDATLVHLEVDAEAHLELVRALDVRRTPTTLILDRTGQELTRAAGAPRRDQVLAALPELETAR